MGTDNAVVVTSVPRIPCSRAVVDVLPETVRELKHPTVALGNCLRILRRSLGQQEMVEMAAFIVQIADAMESLRVVVVEYAEECFGREMDVLHGDVSSSALIALAQLADELRVPAKSIKVSAINLQESTDREQQEKAMVELCEHIESLERLYTRYKSWLTVSLD